MKLTVKAYPKSSRREVRKEDGIFKVYVTEPPDKGKANKAILGLLSEYFGVPKSNMRIIRGECNRTKVIEIGKE